MGGHLPSCSLFVKSFTRKRDSSLVLQLIPLLLVIRSYIQSRSDQPVGRVKQVVHDRHSAVLPVEVFEMEKRLLILSLAKPLYRAIKKSLYT